MANPSNSQIEKALRKALGNKLVVVKGAYSRGRPWNVAPKGLAAHIFHHTATPSATGNKGAPSLRYVSNLGGNMPFCNALVGRDGKYYVLSFGSCWHSGAGGPWPSRGFNSSTGNMSSVAFWGVEIDDPGRGKTITKAQIDSAAKAAAAIGDLCKWDQYAFVTHGDWTDAGPYLMNPQGKQERGYGPNRRRKTDTLRQYYSGKFWRAEVAKYRKEKSVFVKDVNAVDLDSLVLGSRNGDIEQVNEALSKEFNIIFRDKSLWNDKSAMAYARWQRQSGHVNANGKPDIESLKELGQKYKFEVVE